MAIDELIKTNATGPKSASADDVSAAQHPLKDQIAADEYLRARAAANKSRLPLRFQKIRARGVSG